MYELFIASDCSLLEINPMAEDVEGDGTFLIFLYINCILLKMVYFEIILNLNSSKTLLVGIILKIYKYALCIFINFFDFILKKLC